MDNLEPSNSGLKPRTKFMTMPAEVRHRIYRHLLCPTPQPVWLHRFVPIIALLGQTELPHSSQKDPWLHTAIFLLDKQIHDDAIMFAYSKNDFQIREDFAVFCGLGCVALSSIHNLIILPTMWRHEGPREREMWSKLQLCTNLNRLEIYMHPDVLLPAVRWFGDLRRELRSSSHRPRIILDLCVWEKHLSFDQERLEYRRTTQLLEENEAATNLTPVSIEPQHRITRLPLQARMILLTADVSAATLRALDDHLQKSSEPLFTKTTTDLPDKGTRSIGGRAERLWYELRVC